MLYRDEIVMNLFHGGISLQLWYT